MKIGFTGTRRGMSDSQRLQFLSVMRWFHDVTEFHHGAAIGADSEADEMVRQMNGVDTVVKHPATKGKELERNRDIVEVADILIAVPRDDREELRSGTWATIRYARAKGIPIVMLSRRRI